MILSRMLHTQSLTSLSAIFVQPHFSIHLQISSYASCSPAVHPRSLPSFPWRTYNQPAGLCTPCIGTVPVRTRHGNGILLIPVTYSACISRTRISTKKAIESFICIYTPAFSYQYRFLSHFRMCWPPTSDFVSLAGSDLRLDQSPYPDYPLLSQ